MFAWESKFEVQDEDPMSSRLIFRRYEDGDEQAIVLLLKKAFGKWHSLDYWRWMYKKNPAGEPIIWVAQHGKTIVGHYAIIPVRMEVANKNFIGSQSVNLATHPAYQRQNVASSIIARSHKNAGNNNLLLTFNFSRASLEPFFEKVLSSRTHIYFKGFMVRVLNWPPLPARYVHRNPFLKRANWALRKAIKLKSVSARVEEDLKIERINRFDERITRFWNAISKNFQIILTRDQEYLNWRYPDNPEGDYVIYIAQQDKRILGYCVLAEDHGGDMTVGLILDVLGFQNSKKIASSLIQVAVEHFQKRNLDLVACMMSEGNPYTTAFSRAGFIKSPFRRIVLSCTINLPSGTVNKRPTFEQMFIRAHPSFLKERKNWFMLFGDSNWI